MAPDTLVTKITTLTYKGRVYLDLKELVIVLKSCGYDQLANDIQSGGEVK